MFDNFLPALLGGNFDPGKIHRFRDVHIVQVSEGNPSAPIVIVGNGNSVSFDPNGHVACHDPLHYPRHTTLGEYGNCTVYDAYFPQNCDGLYEAAKQIADFVNNLPADRKVVLNGHSKCGCCFIMAAAHIQRSCSIVSVSSPLRGTPVADLEEFQEKLSSRLLKWLYLSIFSDHRVDRDIIPGSDFLSKLAGILPQVNNRHHLNLVVSKCAFSFNPLDFALWLLDKWMGIDGDGIVPYTSQFPEGTLVPEFSEKPNEINGIRYYYLSKSHATSLKGSLKRILWLRRYLRNKI